jgi:hypothetical protein
MSQKNESDSSKDLNYKKMISSLDNFRLTVPKSVDITKDIDNKVKTIKNMETTLKALYYNRDYKNIKSYITTKLFKNSPTIMIKSLNLKNKKTFSTNKTLDLSKLNKNIKKSKIQNNPHITDSNNDKKKKLAVTFNLTKPNELFSYSNHTEPLSHREEIKSDIRLDSNNDFNLETKTDVNIPIFKSNLRYANGIKNTSISSSSLFLTNVDFLSSERKDLSLHTKNLEQKIKSMKTVYHMNHYSLDSGIISPRMNTTASNTHRPTSKNFKKNFLHKEIDKEKFKIFSELSTNVYHTTNNSENNLDQIVNFKDKREISTSHSRDFAFNSEATSRPNSRVTTSQTHKKFNLTHEAVNKYSKKIKFENKCNSLCEIAEDFKHEIRNTFKKPTRDKKILDPHHRNHILSEDDYQLIKKEKYDTLQHILDKNQRIIDCQAIEKINPDLVYKAKELMNKRYQIFTKEKTETEIDKMLKMEKIHSQRNKIFKIVDNLYTDKLKLMWKIDHHKLDDKKRNGTKNKY